jgi:hypothetical protein
MRAQEGVLSTGQCLRGDFQEELTRQTGIPYLAALHLLDGNPHIIVRTKSTIIGLFSRASE